MRASIRDFMLRRALKGFLKHSKESGGVLGQEKAQERELKLAQAGKQEDKQLLRRQAGKQALGRHSV